MSVIAVYPGSFDPVTRGHLDIAARAASLFSELHVVVVHNPSKSPRFSSEQRVELIRAIADSEAHGFVKVLTVPGKDRILGVTIVGVHAGDLLAEYVLAMKHGLGLNKILGTIHTYPTLAEANKYAAGNWKRAHAPQDRKSVV